MYLSRRRRRQSRQIRQGCVRKKEAGMFKANVGGVDRAARLLVGAVVLTVAAWFEATSGGWRGGVAGLIGLFVFVSGLTRFCILYVPFGISTSRAPDARPYRRNSL
jgi:hypothetical protein